LQAPTDIVDNVLDYLYQLKTFAKNGAHNNRKKNTNILDKKYG
jgi:hypothetical protein